MELVRRARIPVPTATCHASTIVQRADGALECAWFGGSAEGAPDTAIWGSRRQPGGEWTPPACWADAGPEPHWNPVLHAEGPRCWLFFKVGPDPGAWRTMVCERDGPGSWSAPRLLVAGDDVGRGPVKNKLLRLAGGEWLAPASSERQPDGWRLFVDRSPDQGRTWERTPDLDCRHAIQPTLWAGAGDDVHLLARTAARAIYRADSRDGGRTWSAPYPLDVPHNNSGIDLTRTSDGRLVLAHNPVASVFGPRTPLVLSVSHDDGATWTRALTIEDEPGAEFSYPSLIPASSAGLHISYTWKRQAIALAEVSP